MTLFDLPTVKSQISSFASHIKGDITSMSPLEKSLLFVEASCLAYFDQTSLTIAAKAMGYTESKRIGVRDNQSATMLFTDTDVVLAFRGTDNIPNIAEDLACDMVHDHQIVGKVHHGFLDDTEALWPLCQLAVPASKKLWLTGHSLGGAMAGIAMVQGDRNIARRAEALYTFGQPRIGNGIYVAHLRTPHERWVNHFDLIPHLPMPWQGYRHFGKLVYVGEKGVVTPMPVLRRISHFTQGMLHKIPEELTLADHNIVKYRQAVLDTIQQGTNAN